MRPTRRGLLVGCLATLAGCTAPGTSGGPEPGTATDSETGASTATATAASPDSATPAAELDLREANVTAVSFERSGGSVSFDVTLYHDDAGEDGYANWWQVERLDGSQVGRRELLHAHGTREFTRSDSFEVQTDVTCVVVRGHDQTHGYGGQAALVNLGSGAVSLVRQGSEPARFGPEDCP